MAHFAEIDQFGKVKRVIVVDNKDTADALGVEKEHIGAAFCRSFLAAHGSKRLITATSEKTMLGLATTGMKRVTLLYRPSLLIHGCLMKTPASGKHRSPCLLTARCIAGMKALKLGMK